jgi:hypothetical protein
MGGQNTGGMGSNTGYNQVRNDDCHPGCHIRRVAALTERWTSRSAAGALAKACLRSAHLHQM